MMIKTLHIEQLFNEYSYTVDLCDGLTYLISPNGYGKSTLMRLLNAVLQGNTEFISTIPFSRFDIVFDDDTRLIVENDNGKLRLLIERAEIANPITAEEMATLMGVTYIPAERLVVIKDDGCMEPALASYAEELSDAVRDTMAHPELVMQPGEGRPEKTDAELEFWAKDLKSKLEFMADAGFEPDIPSGLRFPPTRYELSSKRDEYEDLIYAVADYVDRNYKFAESIIAYKDIVNDIFINKSISISETGKFTVTMDNGSSLQLPFLSSGERQILIMFYSLLFHSQPGSLVILDEPEISLHVSWQQKLGGFFTNICRVRDLQMIVATHSPQVIHSLWDLSRELRVENA